MNLTLEKDRRWRDIVSGFRDRLCVVKSSKRSGERLSEEKKLEGKGGTGRNL